MIFHDDPWPRAVVLQFQVILASNLPDTLLDLFLGFQSCRRRELSERELYIRYFLLSSS